jgi:small subunit ribosomal protein S7
MGGGEKRSGTRDIAPLVERLERLAIRWLVGFARDRREKVMAERLSAEMLDALAGQGGAFKKKDDIFRMAQANKAFAHYRW